MNHDNPRTIGFVEDEMTLKATLFVCVSIIISKALVSCVIGLEERLRPSMTPIAIGVLFFMTIILCHCTNSFFMKHIDALESSNASISIAMDSSYFIMIGNRNKVLGLN